MPPAPVPRSVADFLRLPNFAVVATLRANGSPHCATTWYDWEDGRVLLNMDHTRTRLGHVRRDPRVALTVLDREDPYRHISLLGVVDEIRDDEGLRDIDRLALRYTGKPYMTRDSRRVSAWMRVDRWHGWDASGGRLITDAGWLDGEG
jgi:PPOX class probable F420-dependent enzyme